MIVLLVCLVSATAALLEDCDLVLKAAWSYYLRGVITSVEVALCIAICHGSEPLSLLRGGVDLIVEYCVSSVLRED